MDQFQKPRLYKEDLLSSTSSNEKMDTVSEFLRSVCGTPNSILSDCDDPESDILRLQNPTVLRLAGPERADGKLNDSLITGMAGLMLDSPYDRPKNLCLNSTRPGATLTITTDPLTSPGSLDDNFPDANPMMLPKFDVEKDSSLSPADDKRWTPQRNTSKNNLDLSDNFVTADSHVPSESLNASPVIAQRVRRKIVAMVLDSPMTSSPFSNPTSDEDDYAIRFADRTVGHSCMPHKVHEAQPELHSTPGSPEALPSSSQADRPANMALLHPSTARRARPRRARTARRAPSPRRAPDPAPSLRRKVQPKLLIELCPQPPVEDDSCSLDTISGCSLGSEEEPPAPADDRKRSKSSNTLSECSDPIQENSAAKEFRDERSWLAVDVQSIALGASCDMKVIEPFKRVVSHGGYSAQGAALIVFSACYLPDSKQPDYRYVMDNLFQYVIWSLERMVIAEYVLVYLHGSTGRRKIPRWSWVHECYKQIDRRLRKSLKHLYLVHPTVMLKSFVFLAKPFVSSKFFRKLTYVTSLAELLDKVPLETSAIPEEVKQFDQQRR